MESTWYEEYLRSPHWTIVRERKLEASGHRCERCGQLPRRLPGGGLVGVHIHHLTYERVHHERLEDLEVLCEFCHQVEHGRVADTEAERERALRRQSRRLAALAIACWWSEDDEIDLEVQAWDAAAERVGF